jgi:hypothetical protein
MKRELSLKEMLYLSSRPFSQVLSIILPANLILQDAAAALGGPRTIVFYFVKRCCVVHAELSIKRSNPDVQS